MSETPKHMKSRAVRDGWKEVLADVEAGQEIVVERYNRPVARIIPYKETVMYTVEIQATDDGQIWQAVHAVETITTDEAAARGYAHATDVARDVAAHQDVAEGEGWRVRVWEGEEPDGTPDGECYWNELDN